MDTARLEEYTAKAVELAMGYAPKLVLAAITLIGGLWFVGRLGRLVERIAERRKLDSTLTPFLVSLVTWCGRGALFISVASIVGIETTSFVAVLGAAGLAVGLALQGSLANFAGGALILIFRPYKVGDLIEAQGHLGVVQEVKIFTTTLLSAQNKRIILPNGPVSNGTIINVSAEGTLRVDLVIGIAYEADIDVAQKVIHEVLKADERVLATPESVVEVVELADSSVNLVVRPHTKAEHYWGVHFDTLKNAKKALDKAGISIPYPQRDVHMYPRTVG